MNAQLKPASNPQYLKVLADGTQVPTDDPRTDHVAVLDTTRNLLIHVNSIGVKGRRASQEKLKEEIAKLDVLGGGWRMAGRFEAESILDLTRYNPAFDPNLFPGIKPEGHWTADPAAWAPARAAWWVDLIRRRRRQLHLLYDGWALAFRSAGQ